MFVENKPLSNSYGYFATSMQLKEFPKWDNSWQCIIKALQYTAAQ